MRYLAAVFALLLATGASAQEATLTTPEVLPSPEAVTRLVVSEVHLSTGGGYVTVEFRGATAARRSRTFAVAQGELVSFITAIDTARPTETGGVARRFNFRVLGWLADNSKIVNDAALPIAVTLVP